MRSREVGIVAAVLEVPLVLRGIIGLIGDAQVVRDLVTEGTWPHAALMGFLAAENWWALLALGGAGLFWWALDWWPLQRKRPPGAAAVDEPSAPPNGGGTVSQIHHGSGNNQTAETINITER